MRTALARRNARDAVVAEQESKAVREGRQAEWGGGLGGVVGRVVWRAREGGRAGRVGRLAGWDGGQPADGWRGMDLRSKECSGVVT